MSLLSADDFTKARAKMWRAQERYNCFPDLYVILNDEVVFNMKSPEIGLMTANLKVPEPFIACHMSHGMLQKVVHKKYHWNDAELGMHIEFTRRPNVFSNDFHNLMSFFHV